jgi:hypothetical protein
MFLLIPALLLAMEVAPFSSVTVHPPKFTHSTAELAQPEKPEVHVRVTIRGESMQAELRRTDGPGPDIETIPLADGRHDFAALERFAVAVKRSYPSNSKVELTAESDITLSTVVEAMDALRGRECSLPEADTSDECLLWQVVVTS